MITSLEVAANHSLEVLAQYEKENFTAHTSLKCEGEIANLMNGIDNLGQSISSMLLENKNNGLSLQNSSNNLLNKISILNENSTAAAASLEETAAAVEEINGNITNSAQSVLKMSQYAQEVTDSTSKGQDLANKTMESMEKINEEVFSY